MRRFREEEVRRMKQLWRAGFDLGSIARAFDTDNEAVYYHVKSDGKGNLADFVRALLPHLPTEGPPLPSGYSLTWSEKAKLKGNEGQNRAR